MNKEILNAPPRIWALLGARAGDNDQVIALVEALGLPFETKRLEYNRLHLLGPRLLGRSLASLTAHSRELILHEAPPDLTISAGHRNVAAVQALRRRSAGRTRSIHIGFPRVAPSQFDLVIATPQYPIPDHPNLLRIPYALTRAETVAADPTDLAKVTALGAPRRLLVIGGPTLYWKLDRPQLLQRLSMMLDEARHGRGSVLVTTSPRTPPRLQEEIAAILEGSEVPNLLAKPKGSPSYASLLAGADSIHVTADSVSMISDAIWTGKPVAVVPVAKSMFARLAFVIADAFCPGRRIYPQDLRFFWSALREGGVTEQLAIPRFSTADERQMVLDRSSAVMRRNRPA